MGAGDIISSASFLVPVRYEEVEVCGERVLAAVTEDGKAYFSPRHVCDALGILWHGQYEKIKADPVLSTCVQEICTQLPGSGQRRKYTMLPIEYANGWLFTIKKVRPELQAKLNLFRTEGYATLTLIRKQDGSVEFVDENGNKVIAHGNEEMSRLFKTLDALV
jgi:hypothetical protein